MRSRLSHFRPIGKSDLHQSLPVGVKSFIAPGDLSVFRFRMAPPMRPGAAGVRESVLVGKVPRAENTSAFVPDIRIRRQRSHRAPHEQRCFRFEKIRILSGRRRAVAFGNAKINPSICSERRKPGVRATDAMFRSAAAHLRHGKRHRMTEVFTRS